MRRADQYQAVQGGEPAVGPVSPMVGVAPFRRNIAGGEGAAAVAEGYGAAHGAGDGAACSAYVQWLTVAAEDDRDDFRVAGHPPYGAGGQVFAGVQHTGADLGGELVIRHGQYQCRAFPALFG